MKKVFLLVCVVLGVVGCSSIQESQAKSYVLTDKGVGTVRVSPTAMGDLQVGMTRAVFEDQYGIATHSFRGGSSEYCIYSDVSAIYHKDSNYEKAVGFAALIRSEEMVVLVDDIALDFGTTYQGFQELFSTKDIDVRAKVDSKIIIGFEDYQFEFYKLGGDSNFYLREVEISSFFQDVIRSGIDPQSDNLTIEEIRVNRPWIPETTELVVNDVFPDVDCEYILRDFIDYPFVDDPSVIGTWNAVDYVEEKDQFNPSASFWQGDTLTRVITFLSDGDTDGPWQWTSGHLLHMGGDHTDSLYEIVDIGGELYMFMEHKSGDYAFRYAKPGLYVLQKQ